jgi:hypothetical protein
LTSNLVSNTNHLCLKAEPSTTNYYQLPNRTQTKTQKKARTAL